MGRTHALLASHLIRDQPFLPDHTDAEGSRVRLDPLTLAVARTPWACWPGRWGGTRPENQILGDIGVEANTRFRRFYEI